VVMAWAVDRLGRSLPHLANFFSELQAKKVDLFIYQQGVDTTTPAGKALFGMMGVFAEFERAIMQERIKAGIKRFRANGRRWGRRTELSAIRTPDEEGVIETNCVGKVERCLSEDGSCAVHNYLLEVASPRGSSFIRSRQADGEHGKLFACGLPTWVVSGALVGESFFRRNVSRKSWRPGPTTRISKPLEIRIHSTLAPSVLRGGQHVESKGPEHRN